MASISATPIISSSSISRIRIGCSMDAESGAHQRSEVSHTRTPFEPNGRWRELTLRFDCACTPRHQNQGRWALAEFEDDKLRAEALAGPAQKPPRRQDDSSISTDVAALA